MATLDIRQGFDPIAALRSTEGVRACTPLTDEQRARNLANTRAHLHRMEWATAKVPRTYLRLYNWRPLDWTVPRGRGSKPPAHLRKFRYAVAMWRPLAGLAMFMWRLRGKPGRRKVEIYPL